MYRCSVFALFHVKLRRTVSRETSGGRNLQRFHATLKAHDHRRKNRCHSDAPYLQVVAGMQIANEKAIATLTERTIQAMDAISRLARIADAPEDRISDLEDGGSRN
jgi:hypothetical protein